MAAPETVGIQTQLDLHPAGKPESVASPRLTPEQATAITNEFENSREDLLRYAGQFVKSPDEAEDLVQETFVKAIAGISSFTDSGEGLRPWLYRIALNTRIDQARKEKRHPVIPQDFEAEVSSISPLWSDGMDTERTAVGREGAREQLTGWVRDLGSSVEGTEMIKRSIASFYLKISGFSDAEAAEILGTGIATLRTGRHRLQKRVITAKVSETLSA